LAEVFRLLGQPVRIQILLILGNDDACVCHIEAILGIRQAAISQHLMILRDAGLVVSARDGRNIFYRVANPDLLAVIYKAASVSGIFSDTLSLFHKKPVLNCPCPRCNPEMDPDLTCRNIDPS
jgi:DNA-binding transcriptional ArsR family regulator